MKAALGEDALRHVSRDDGLKNPCIRAASGQKIIKVDIE